MIRRSTAPPTDPRARPGRARVLRRVGRTALPALAPLLVVGAAAAEPVVVRVESKSVTSGSTYALGVTVASADSLAGLHLRFTYGGNRNAVTTPPAALGTASDRRVRARPFAGYPDSSGTLDVAWLSAAGVSGADTLLTLPLEARGSGGTSDTIRVEVVDAVDRAGNPVASTTENGVVSFTSEVGVSERNSARFSFRLASNPALRGAVLDLSVPSRERARVEIYDSSGRRVRVLWNGPLGPGRTSLSWSGEAEDGRRAASGVYYALARTGGETARVKFVLIR